MTKAKVTNLRKHYPELSPDKDYPPLKFKSLKGKVSAAEWEARVERQRLLRNLGDAEVMLLHNHGTLALGKTVAEAFNNMYRLEHACRTQLLAQMGLLEWPAMRRLADRLDPSYKT